MHCARCIVRDALCAMRCIVRSAPVEEVDAGVGAEGEVVVLARAVDALEGLLVQQADEAVLGRNLLHELHHLVRGGNMVT